MAREIARRSRPVQDPARGGPEGGEHPAGPEAVDLLAGADGFAEVYPEDKYLVVRHLQAAGHVTGMTGDGVNDAPALRQAEVGIAVSSATDVAKGAASVVLTEPGLTNIVALVEQGRTIYQRVLTWIVNKISRTILKAAFVAIAFVVTGKFVVSAFAMLLLVFMTDFAQDRPGDRPRPAVAGTGDLEHRRLHRRVRRAGRRHGRGGAPPPVRSPGRDSVWRPTTIALYTFSFLTLLYFAVFSIVSARERSWFWSTMPSKTLMAALAADVLIGTVLTLVGIPDLPPLPGWQTAAIFGYAMVACLGVNDALKVAMLKARARGLSGSPA